MLRLQMRDIVQIGDQLYGRLGPAGQQEQEPKEEPKKRKGEKMSDSNTIFKAFIATVFTFIALFLLWMKFTGGNIPIAQQAEQTNSQRQLTEDEEYLSSRSDKMRKEIERGR